MDQNSENGTDKRNWRERLGIGAADGQKAMPKAADGFKPAEAPVAAAAPRPASPAPVRAAPMAPRPAPRPATPVAPRAAPVAADALANKLKTQREAAEKLAVQRVQAAKQKAEASIAQATNTTGKPKFSFADEEAKLAGQQQPQSQPVAQVQRPIQTQPPRPALQQPYSPPPNPYAGQVQPPRPQLGVNPGYVMPPAYPQGQPYQPMPPQQGYQPQYQQPPYQQPPAYRPIDPNTGYAPQPGHNPNMRPQYVPPSAQPSQGQPPRLQVPPRAGAGSGFAPNPRLTNPPQRTPQMPMAGDDGEDDVFEQPQMRPTRRATAGEYQQAYRNEVAYEEEPQRSNGLWMILGLAVLGLLVAIGAVLGYSHYLKPQLSSSNGGTVPVIAAPATPTKVVPDKTSAASDQPVKKLIYDRIEGDHEVPGGQVQSTEEAPAQPAGSGTNISPPVDPNKAAAPVDSTGTGADGVPLPLPPPPGGGTGQQGSIEPSDKTDIANVTPAAEQSSAANLSQSTALAGQTQITPTDAKIADIAPPPVPGSQPAAKPLTVASKPQPVQPVQAKQPTKLADAGTQGSEEIGAEKPVVAKKLPLATAAKPTKSLGANPVVLVPPSNIAEPTVFAKPKAKSKTAVALAEPDAPAAPADGNSIYGGGTDAAATPSFSGTDVTQPKKTKSIFDLFKASNAPATPAAATTVAPPAETVVAPVVPTKPAAQVAMAAPQASAPAAGTGAYVVQLASFKSRAEATAEYQRLGAKHGPIITRYAPIIEAAQVAGSTRYRLNLGPMASTSVASSVCSSLFAAGERDCIVHRQ